MRGRRGPPPLQLQLLDEVSRDVLGRDAGEHPLQLGLPLLLAVMPEVELGARGGAGALGLGLDQLTGTC